MQNEYAALTGATGVKSGAHEAAIGRSQIEDAEQIIRSLSDIWLDLIKRRNGHISRADVDFIAKKLESLAQTQKGHLHQAFSLQRMGAVVNLLTEEAGRRLNAEAAACRRDLTIMAREHEAFSAPKRVVDQALKVQTSTTQQVAREHTVKPEKTPDSPGYREPNSAPGLAAQKTIGSQIWSWGVVGSVVLFVLAGGFTFMTSSHPWAADGFYLAGTALFLCKFWTWEETSRQPPMKKRVLQAAVTVLAVAIAVAAVFWNHIINQPAFSSGSNGPTAPTPKPPDHTPGAETPSQQKPEGPGNPSSTSAGGRTLSVSDRVKLIIAQYLQVNEVQLKPNADFEADLGATPTDVYSVMQALGLEYDITISSSDSTKLHTVGETIAYIEQKVQEKQQQEKKRKHVEKHRPAPEGDEDASLPERVMAIIVKRLDLDPAKIKHSDDFEVNLHASPTEVYLLMRDLELEYQIKIPPEDAKRLHTVGETIAYVQMREQPN
jgi:acyl carrier protein